MHGLDARSDAARDVPGWGAMDKPEVVLGVSEWTPPGRRSEASQAAASLSLGRDVPRHHPPRCNFTPAQAIWSVLSGHPAMN